MFVRETHKDLFLGKNLKRNVGIKKLLAFHQNLEGNLQANLTRKTVLNLKQ